MTLETGYQLQQGRYVIQTVLGQGGMGTVYLAADRNLPGRLVAIKENADATQPAQEQFQHEAVMLARLTHPNLPRVTDHFVDTSGLQYLVMDYIEGDDLREMLRQQGTPFPEALALEWIGQVMNALDHMHNWIDPATRRPSPIIHRDIKPGNIKRSPNGRIVLVDFGLAKYDDDGDGTIAGARAVTPGYSPVEQYTGGTNLRSDIYALGATLYTLVTAQKPPDSPALAGGLRLTPPRQLNPQLSRTTERVILRAMQVQGADRYQSVAEMYEALFNRRALGINRGSQTVHQSEYTLAPYKKKPPPRTFPGPISWISGLLLIGILAAGIFWSTSYGWPIALPALPTGLAMAPTATDAASTPQDAPTPTLTPTNTLTPTVQAAPTIVALPPAVDTTALVPFTATVTTTLTPAATTAPITATVATGTITTAPITATVATGTIVASTAPSPTLSTALPPTVQPSATATVTPAPSPTATPSASPTRLPTITPTLTAVPTATATTAISTATATATAAPTQPPTSTPTHTQTLPPTHTATRTPTHTPTPRPLPTNTATNTATAKPTATATLVATMTATRTPLPSPTLTSTLVASTAPVVGDVRINPRDQAAYVFVPAGEFVMGSTLERDEAPEHTVTVDSFWIGQTEITNAQYGQCVDAGVCTPPGNTEWRNAAKANHPVTDVDWEQANTYATWVGGRLPTEAEWEKTARGTAPRIFPWGDELTGDQQLNFNARTTVAVGSYPAGASPYGALDMAGNVEEWVADWYAPDYYGQSPANNPTGPAAGIFRGVRGGSFNSNRGDVRTSKRGRAFPDTGFSSVGFRVVVPER